MSAFVPKVYYNSKKLLHIQSVLDPLPATKNVVLEGTRGAGCLIIGGGKSSYDVVITGILLACDLQLPDGSALLKPTGTEYEKIMLQKAYLETTVAAENVDRVLQVEKVDGTYTSYTVRRIVEIEYPANQRISIQEFTVRLRVVNP